MNTLGFPIDFAFLPNNNGFFAVAVSIISDQHIINDADLLNFSALFGIKPLKLSFLYPITILFGKGVYPEIILVLGYINN